MAREQREGRARVLLLLLLAPVITQGEVANSRQLTQVRTFESEVGEVCLRPLEPRVEAKLQLSVISTYSHSLFLAGETKVTTDMLEENVWHNVSYRLTSVDRRHALAVMTDGVEVPFTRTGNIFTSAFKFREVILLIKGEVEVSDCPPPPDPTTTTTTTTPTPTPDADDKSTSPRGDANNTAKTEQDNSSWCCGPVPVLAIVLAVGAVVVMAAVAGTVFCYKTRIRNSKQSRTNDLVNDSSHSTHPHNNGTSYSSIDNQPQP